MKEKVYVVMPAYNAAKTLELTYNNIPPGVVDDVLLVDDCSKDNTLEVAKGLGVKYIAHKRNMGYGANQKTCYSRALEDGATIVVLLHPDYQYDPAYIPELIAPILEKRADAVLGSRILNGGALKGGMPLYKYLGNRFLTALENRLLGQSLSEFHTGFRAYSRKILTAVNWHKNAEGFLFDTQILVQIIAAGFKITEIGVPTKYFKDASSTSFKASLLYGIGTVYTVAEYYLTRRT